MRGESIYKNLYVKNSYRALKTPRVARPWRPRVIAWSGPTAFMRDRFYEIDDWYKARIHKPELLPKLHVIDPDKIVQTFEERSKVQQTNLINIGFKKPSTKNLKETDNNLELMEKLARKNLLKIDLSQSEINDLAIINHFKVFSDLFMPGIYFYNTQKMEILFNENSYVYFGNSIKAENAQNTPIINIPPLNKKENDIAGYNTLLMVNLDGDAFTKFTDYKIDKYEKRQQMLHWFVGNIYDLKENKNHNNNLNTMIPYLPPIPFHGTGYHRFVFILFRHLKQINFEQYFAKFKNTNDAQELLLRQFDTNDFTKKHEDIMTPCAIKFCQIKWDKSVDKTLHNLGVKSPRYWYEWNENLKPIQKEFPLKPMPFNKYLDMYRPPELVQREIQQQRLEFLVNQIDFNEKNSKFVKKSKYPDIFYQENVKKLPRWQHDNLLKKNKGESIYAALYSNYINPTEQHCISEKVEEKK